MDLDTIAQQSFDAYRMFQEAHPILGSIATAEVIFPLGDISSQLITDGRVDWKKVRYSAALAPFYGVASYGLMKSGDVIGFIIDHPLAKAALGPNLWGNFFNTIFFVNNTVGEKTGYCVSALAQHYWALLTPQWSIIKEQYFGNIPVREYLYATAGTLTVWNAFQWWNYSSVPKELQTPAALGASLFWMVLMSLWSLKGRRKITVK
ncbi:hypothetical protein HY639_04795 [Candidatus Woesearchaeota archaeon]|nr:hypothetical protein [Candidatus Woesearchaeota archaeon]